MATLRDVEKILNRFSNVIVIDVLEDNKHNIGTFTMEKEVFIEELWNKEYIYNGGGDREFYVKKNNREFTCQISNFELDTELNF